MIISAIKSVISARGPNADSLRIKPVGDCINELAIMIQSAETEAAIATIQMLAKCNFLEILSLPKIQMPRKVDSTKNAASASIARGAPKTSPTNLE